MSRVSADAQLVTVTRPTLSTPRNAATSTRAAFEGCSIVSWYGETVARGWSGRNVTEMQTIKNSGPSRLIKAALSLLVLSVCGLNTESNGQQLRDAFHSVQQAVVIVRTQQQGLAPYPQQGLVSLNGLGSGVLISNDGKVLTAAHLVQSADRTMVEFSQGELVPATVIGRETLAAAEYGTR